MCDDKDCDERTDEAADLGIVAFWSCGLFGAACGLTLAGLGVNEQLSIGLSIFAFMGSFAACIWAIIKSHNKRCAKVIAQSATTK